MVARSKAVPRSEKRRLPAGHALWGRSKGKSGVAGSRCTSASNARGETKRRPSFGAAVEVRRAIHETRVMPGRADLVLRRNCATACDARADCIGAPLLHLHRVHAEAGEAPRLLGTLGPLLQRCLLASHARSLAARGLDALSPAHRARAHRLPGLRLQAARRPLRANRLLCLGARCHYAADCRRNNPAQCQSPDGHKPTSQCGFRAWPARQSRMKIPPVAFPRHTWPTQFHHSET